MALSQQYCGSQLACIEFKVGKNDLREDRGLLYLVVSHFDADYLPAVSLMVFKSSEK